MNDDKTILDDLENQKEEDQNDVQDNVSNDENNSSTDSNNTTTESVDEVNNQTHLETNDSNLNTSNESLSETLDQSIHQNQIIEENVKSRFNVSLQDQNNEKVFNGAFDLFYSLIKERKMDILNFDLTILTQQYVEFIRNNLVNMKIEDMTEYLLMATYLLELKSKKALPIIERQVDAESEIERDKFIQRLLVYKQYQDIIPKLVEKMETRSYMYAKESSNFDEYLNNEEHEVFLPESIDLNKLLTAMQNVYLKLEGKKKAPNIKIIDVSEISIDDVELEIRAYLDKININDKISLSQYLSEIPPEKFSKQYFVVTFVAFLVLVRNRYINLEQSENASEIYIIKVNRDVEMGEEVETSER